MTRYPQWLRDAIRRDALDNNTVEPGGVYRRPAIRPAAFYDPYGIQFVWDLCYSGYAIARVGAGPAITRDALENHLEFAVTTGPDTGMLPRSVTADGGQAGQDGSQAPLLAWLAREVHHVEPNPEWLGRVYPGLAAFVDWWQSERRDVDGDGLSEYAGSTVSYVAYESGHDYSPERDLVVGTPTAEGTDGLVHEPFADVFLNSCLYMELDALAELAGIVDPDREAEWRERRDRLGEIMRTTMWNDRVGGFFPVTRTDVAAKRQHIVRHTPAMLMPLWAGIATQEQADRTVRTLIGDPHNYPLADGALVVTLDRDALAGYRIETDGLHPSRGAGGAAGGAEVLSDGLRIAFGADRGPAHESFTRVEIAATFTGVTPGARAAIVLRDGRGTEHRLVEGEVPDDGILRVLAGGDPMVPGSAATWTAGLTLVDIRATGAALHELRIDYSRFARRGLLNRHGIKSAHPLDGKHPAPGAPSEFWSGTLWGPHQLHACQALDRYGYRDLARSIARAYCDTVTTAYAASGGVFEHNSHEDGTGLGTRGYTWGGGTALVLMRDFVDPDD